jgi:16S rRNA G966 N2-methylase RsmD
MLAAEYGFEKVTGVDLARELCELARKNAAHWRFRAAHPTPINIMQMDALDFCENSDDDIFFMYRPFSKEFLERILEKLAAAGARQKKPLMIIYSERMAHATSHRDAIAQHAGFEQVHESGTYGQAFYVYRSVPLSNSDVAPEKPASGQPQAGRAGVNLA